MVGQALIATLEVSLGRHFTEPVSGLFGVFEIFWESGFGNAVKEGRRRLYFFLKFAGWKC